MPSLPLIDVSALPCMAARPNIDEVDVARDDQSEHANSQLCPLPATQCACLVDPRLKITTGPVLIRKAPGASALADGGMEVGAGLRSLLSSACRQPRLPTFAAQSSSSVPQRATGPTTVVRIALRRAFLPCLLRAGCTAVAVATSEFAYKLMRVASGRELSYSRSHPPQ
ncbi:hypothetical protein BU23DRAFT_148905 [Bimuria novae-zelandiae CBS 107.79]|uniref:Uncharacterized protein n=1 Tax=Bimuria novae-zelandiae CBS 107.79 TaxID=1447943 RepID=A0A6A5VQC4_9PLEO|nr:hypothetical protein BU23DRAFT_148905 [Bimuria novae-zelandiae CBS 107.79]